ncbi:MAG: hypothetical protein KKE11_07005 [Gammaproteobacteria bacterium]|nr:hypothetical protein [Gammaproteobacteria bacterium]
MTVNYNEQNIQQTILEAITPLMRDPKTTHYFVKSCIVEQLKSTVENHSKILVDKDTFLPDEIELMKKSTLNELECYIFPDTHEGPDEFKVKFRETFFSFSNRGGNTELRGERLRLMLTDLKEKNPNLTLYDALTKFIQHPGLMTEYFATPVFQADPHKEEIFATLTKLSEAGLDYLWVGKSQNISEDELEENLKRAFSSHNKELLTLALAGGSEEDLCQFLQSKTGLTKTIEQAEIKKTGLIQANEWLKTVQDLTKQNPKAQPMATAAKNLLDWYSQENPDLTQEKKIVNDFKIAGNEAQKTHLDILSWKNILKIFSFIPSIANLMKSSRKSLWIKHEETARCSLPQKTIEALNNPPNDPQGPEKEQPTIGSPAI